MPAAITYRRDGKLGLTLNLQARTNGYGNRGLLAGIEDHWPLRRLQWFSKGIYSIGRSGDDIVFSDLRMGVEPNYVFRFKIGEFGNPHARPVVPEQLAPVRDYGRLPQFWERIWDPKVRLSPPPSAGN